MAERVQTEVSPKRWLMLACYMIVVFLNGCAYALFAPLAHIFVEVFL